MSPMTRTRSNHRQAIQERWRETHNCSLWLVGGDLVLRDVSGADADGLTEGAVGPSRGSEDPLALLGDGEEARRRGVATGARHHRRGVEEEGGGSLRKGRRATGVCAPPSTLE